MTDHPLAERIVRALSTQPLQISTEAKLQLSIERALMLHQIRADRERSLAGGDRPDFLCDDVVIEAKARYGKRSIYGQLERYAAHDSVAAIVLVTGTAMGMPAAINGKPVYVVSVGMAHL